MVGKRIVLCQFPAIGAYISGCGILALPFGALGRLRPVSRRFDPRMAENGTYDSDIKVEGNTDGVGVGSPRRRKRRREDAGEGESSITLGHSLIERTSVEPTCDETSAVDQRREQVGVRDDT